jgi:hypothetical protein
MTVPISEQHVIFDKVRDGRLAEHKKLAGSGLSFP